MRVRRICNVRGVGMLFGSRWNCGNLSMVFLQMFFGTFGARSKEGEGEKWGDKRPKAWL